MTGDRAAEQRLARAQQRLRLFNSPQAPHDAKALAAAKAECAAASRALSGRRIAAAQEAAT